jgi:hypothetical protein
MGETLDRLYLELSQISKATTEKEARLQREVARLQGLMFALRAEAFAVIDNDTVENREALRKAAEDAL